MDGVIQRLVKSVHATNFHFDVLNFYLKWIDEDFPCTEFKFFPDLPEGNIFEFIDVQPLGQLFKWFEFLQHPSINNSVPLTGERGEVGQHVVTQHYRSCLTANSFFRPGIFQWASVSVRC